ncbi:MAG TPA: DMT family transporter [Hyphomicrobiales bacterium]|nr:DMT family transporter [Hyphomicrobiales bacterium]
MSPGADAAPGERLKGIGYVLIAVSFFACLDTTAKYLGQSLPSLEVVWMRFVSHSLIVLVLWNPFSQPAFYRSGRIGLQVLRALFMFGATAFNFFALRYLQLSETMAIFFAAPFIVAMLAGPLLGEWAGPRRWAAIAVGFLGVVVVMRPGLGGLHWAASLSVGATLSYALYLITTRMLAATDSPQSMLIFSAFLPAAIIAPLVFFVWETPQTALQWVLLFSLGVFGAVGHWFLILAYRQAPAPVLAPFTYGQIITMIAFGYLVFGEVPGLTTIVGAGIVIASGLYLIARERPQKAGD